MTNQPRTNTNTQIGKSILEIIKRQFTAEQEIRKLCGQATAQRLKGHRVLFTPEQVLEIFDKWES